MIILLRILALFAVLSLLAFPMMASAEVTVTIGPTPIPRGDAIGAKDITVSNGIFVVSFAVESPPPWGVARGGIVDIALIENGEPGYDIASLADFMPNNWSSWPTTYQRVMIEKQTSEGVIIRTVRDWGDVELNSAFHISDNSPLIHIVTTMANKGDAALEDLLTGYSIWPDGGHLFGIPGFTGQKTGSEDGAISNWSAAYDETWVIGLHAPYATYFGQYGRDRLKAHRLDAGEERLFEAWLQIEKGGDLKPLVREQIRLAGLASGRVSGRVNGVDEPAIVVSSNGKPFMWMHGEDGRYDFNLPAGDYDIYATARAHSASPLAQVRVGAGDDIEQHFDGLLPPGELNINVVDGETQKGLDARISILKGPKSPIAYYSRSRFFTELETRGFLSVEIQPGDYVFDVSAGGGFSSMPQTHNVTIASGRSHELNAEIPVVVRHQNYQWYSADLHHHSDVLDGFTSPEYVMRSELASGVDITALSDHDSMVNNAEMKRLSDKRGVPFLAGVELSPSWAHFNAFPMDDDKSISIDINTSSVSEIFAEARRLGADVLQVNHPFSNYGYFGNIDLEAVPGGYSNEFDLVEIEAKDSSRTVARTWQLWNSGKRAYFAGGSDVHHVWRQVSGKARTYAYVSGELTVESFLEAVKSGRSFASLGPVVFPDIMFGDAINHASGEELELGFRVQAVAGLREVQLIERGDIVDERTFDGGDQPQRVVFKVNPVRDTWYSLVIGDQQDNFAYTNPVWISIQE